MYEKISDCQNSKLSTLPMLSPSRSILAIGAYEGLDSLVSADEDQKENQSGNIRITKFGDFKLNMINSQ